MKWDSTEIALIADKSNVELAKTLAGTAGKSMTVPGTLGLSQSTSMHTYKRRQSTIHSSNGQNKINSTGSNGETEWYEPNGTNRVAYFGSSRAIMQHKNTAIPTTTTRATRLYRQTRTNNPQLTSNHGRFPYPCVFILFSYIVFNRFCLLPVNGCGDRLKRALSFELADAHDAPQAAQPQAVSVVKFAVGVQQTLRQTKKKLTRQRSATARLFV